MFVGGGSANLPDAEARLNRSLKTTSKRAAGGAAAVVFASVSVGLPRWCVAVVRAALTEAANRSG